MSDNGLVINNSNIHELTQTDILSFSSKEYWHKFILENGGAYDKDAVLQAVLDSISPFDLVPVKFTVTGSDAYFLARNCGQAIEKFCLNLLPPIQLRDNLGQVTLTIHTCHTPIEEFKVNMQLHLKKTIEKRYDESRKGYIDLSSFHREPELYEVLFCPLSTPRFLLYVLSILKRILPVKSINLSNNDIENLKPLEVLKEVEGLRSLDLSNNKISDQNSAEVVGNAVPKLEELDLSGNPICSRFKTEFEYLKWIKNQMPSIRIVDGVRLNYGMPMQQVWLCDNTVGNIVNDFLQHYFTLYDSNRQALEHTYDKTAIFSMTCDLSPSQDSKLESHEQESKNLLKLKGKVKVTGSCHHRNTEIAEVLGNLPATQHDPYSFKVDVPYYQETTIIILVSGIFKYFQEAPRVQSFYRTFVLKRMTQDEYKITNDLYHVTNATENEVNESFSYSKPSESQNLCKLRVNREEERNMVEVVVRLTQMNSAYSKRCLEDCGWDIKKALEIFLENYQTFNIPLDAFSE